MGLSNQKKPFGWETKHLPDSKNQSSCFDSSFKRMENFPETKRVHLGKLIDYLFFLVVLIWTPKEKAKIIKILNQNKRQIKKETSLHNKTGDSSSKEAESLLNRQLTAVTSCCCSSKKDDDMKYRKPRLPYNFSRWMSKVCRLEVIEDPAVVPRCVFLSCNHCYIWRFVDSFMLFFCQSFLLRLVTRSHQTQLMLLPLASGRAWVEMTRQRRRETFRFSL